MVPARSSPAARNPAPSPRCLLLQTLGRLGVQWDKKTRSMRVPRDLYANLLAVGEVTLAGGEPSTGTGHDVTPTKACTH